MLKPRLLLASQILSIGLISILLTRAIVGVRTIEDVQNIDDASFDMRSAKNSLKVEPSNGYPAPLDMPLQAGSPEGLSSPGQDVNNSLEQARNGQNLQPNDGGNKIPSAGGL